MSDPYVVPFKPEPSAFEVLWRKDLTYPFFEDEDANGLYGYGHQDKVAFATAVNDYDAECSGALSLFMDDDECYDSGSVVHAHAECFLREEREADDWRFTIVSEPSEASVPITYIRR